MVRSLPRARFHDSQTEDSPGGGEPLARAAPGVCTVFCCLALYAPNPAAVPRARRGLRGSERSLAAGKSGGGKKK